jgi:superfamily II DNA or RNA helicase
MTRPKPKYYRGQRIDKPWSLYEITKNSLLLPRTLGIQLCGLPPRRRSMDVPVSFPEPVVPLLDETTAALSFKTPQQGHVANLIYRLNKDVETQGFGAAIYSIPTGHGKTASAVHIAAQLGQRTLFITHNDKVHSLNEEEFKKFLGKDFVTGKMQTSNRKSWKHIDAAIVQTTHESAAKCLLDVTRFGTVIVDEAHKTATPTLKNMYMRFPCKYLVLLTATPSRASDHCGAYLEWLGGPLSCYVRIDLSKNRWGGATVREIPYVYTHQKLTEKRDKVKDKYYTNLPETLSLTMHRKDRNKALVDDIVRLVNEEDRHVIVVGVRILHIEHIVKALQTRGVSAGALVGKFTNDREQTEEERQETFKCRVIVAYMSMAVEALNIPRIDTIMQMSGGCPWNNETVWIQFIGRAARDMEGKNKPLIVLPNDVTTYNLFDHQIERAKTTFEGICDGFEFTVSDEHIVN